MEEEEEDEDIDLEEDFETLHCSLNVLTVCVLMPFFNGQINALLTAGYTLHFDEMGWDLVRCGLALTLGFILRMITQILLRTGYWFVVPLCTVNLTFAILAIFFFTSEWALWGEIIVCYGIDAAVAIEGISFDTFGDSEIKARAASSITLSTFTLSVALSCTIGGILYDTLGWTGIACYHTLCEGLLILLLCVQGGCKKSFMETFFPNKDDLEEIEGAQADTDTFIQVVPTGDPPAPANLSLPGAVASEDMEVLDAVPEDEEVLEELPRQISRQSGGAAPDRSSGLSASPNRSSGVSPARTSGHSEGQDRTSQVSVDALNSIGASGGSRTSGGMRGSATRLTPDRGSMTRGSMTRGSMRGSQHRDSMHRGSLASGVSLRLTSQGIRASMKSQVSRRSMASVSSRVSQMSRVSHAAQLMSHGFGVSGALQPKIVGTTGENAMPRHDLDALEDMVERVDAEVPAKAGNIPKDLRFPAFLIVLNAFFNNMTYSMEFATFAIFFKEVHNWNQATFASLAQTSGDVLAAITIQILSRFQDPEYDETEASRLRRFWHFITSSPFNTSVLLFSWIGLNMGMISPVLPVAITAQVVMGTVYVYSVKWTCDMNLFYSLGEPAVFMTLQVMTKNAEAFGGAFAGVLGIALYSWNPLAPFMFGAICACLVFVLYTSGFWWRLGLVDDIELAEAKRARRKGLRRVSSWKSDTGRNTVRKTVKEDED